MIFIYFFNVVRHTVYIGTNIGRKVDGKSIYSITIISDDRFQSAPGGIRGTQGRCKTVSDATRQNHDTN